MRKFRAFADKFTTILFTALPLFILLIAIIVAYNIYYEVGEGDRINAMSAYWTAFAAFIAVIVAVWLEGRKEVAAHQEQKIKQRLACATLLPIIQEMKNEIEALQRGQAVNNEYGDNEMGLIIELRSLNERTPASLQNAMPQIQQLPLATAEVASRLVGELAVYRSRVEALPRDFRVQVGQGQTRARYRLEIAPQLKQMHETVTKLITLISRNAASLEPTS